MSQHVDVVLTNWVEASYERVAIFWSVPGDTAKCDVLREDHAYLGSLQLELDDGRTLTPEDGDAFLAALPEALNSTYVSVLPLHFENDCLFCVGNVAPFQGDHQIALT